MSWTTDDLRELMNERSAELPVAPDRVAGARARARRHHWATAGGAGVAALAVVGATTLGAWWVRGDTETPAPRPAPVVTAPPPTPPAPFDAGRLIHTVRFHGLRITTNGPALVPPATPTVTATFAVIVTAQNLSTRRWTGRISVGVVGRTAERNGPFGMDPVSNHFFADPGDARQPPVIDESAALPGRRLWQGAGPKTAWHIRPGASVRFVLRMGYSGNEAPKVRVAGWLPVLETKVDSFAMPDPDHYRDISWG